MRGRLWVDDCSKSAGERDRQEKEKRREIRFLLHPVKEYVVNDWEKEKKLR